MHNGPGRHQNGSVKRSASVSTAATPSTLYAVVADLATYPGWLELVTTAEPDTTGDPDAWLVTLRASVGPFARSKQLRMVRSVADGAAVRFERQELDGRDHADWIMSASVAPNGADTEHPSGSTVTIELTYDGQLWSGRLDAVLDREINKALSQLPTYLEQSAS